MSNNAGSYISQAADLISLLNESPRTKRELEELTGMSKAAVARWIVALADEAVIEQTTWRRAGAKGQSSAAVFTWAPAQPQKEAV